MRTRLQIKIEKKSPEPLYLQIEKKLTSLMDAKKLDKDDRVPSEDDISEACKVSRMTVRQALINLERKGLIYRIAGKGTFVKGKRTDGSLKSLRTNVAVYLSPITSRYHPYFLQLIEGMEHQAKILGLSISIVSDFERIVDNSSICGGILVKKVPHEEIMKLEEDEIPFVLLYDHNETYGRTYPSVLVDAEDTAFRQTEYLIKLGHRRIALCTGILNGYLKSEGSMKKLKGYKFALGEHGIPFKRYLVRECDYDEEKTRVMTQQILSLSPPPTAIIACDDIGAGVTINTLREKGKRVPDDMSVIGVGDLHLNSVIYPPLTTFRFPTTDIGERSVMLLMQLAKGEEASSVVIRGELVVRESCSQEGAGRNLK